MANGKGVKEDWGANNFSLGIKMKSQGGLALSSGLRGLCFIILLLAAVWFLFASRFPELISQYSASVIASVTIAIFLITLVSHDITVKKTNQLLTEIRDEIKKLNKNLKLPKKRKIAKQKR